MNRLRTGEDGVKKTGISLWNQQAPVERKASRSRSKGRTPNKPLSRERVQITQHYNTGSNYVVHPITIISSKGVGQRSPYIPRQGQTTQGEKKPSEQKANLYGYQDKKYY